MGCDSDLQRFLHWGPILLLSLTLLVTCTTHHMNSMWWRPGQGLGSWVNYMAIWMHLFAMLYNFVRALMVGPGFVPRKWQPKKLRDTEFLQFCQRCEGYKPPRSHHCRRCDRCVLKMDHHCPWINNCVGLSNHISFVYFLLFFLSASVHSGFIVTSALIRGISKRYLIHQNLGHLATVTLTYSNCMAAVLTLGVTVGMGMASIKLLHMQAKVIFTNKTEIERWIIKKAAFRRESCCGKRIKPFVYPYDLGWRANYQEVFVRTGDGFSWPVLRGCHQYTLTVEQLEQKKDKRARTRCFKCIRAVTGSCFPIFSQGILVSLLIPCNDDPRIALQPGDHIHVTRIQTHWLYGERVISEEEKVEEKRRRGAIRGWFPSCCAKEIHDEDSDTEDNMLAAGEPFPGNHEADGEAFSGKYKKDVKLFPGNNTEADEKLEHEKDEVDIQAGGEALLREDAKEILDEKAETNKNMLAGGEPISGNHEVNEKFEKEEDEVDIQAGGEALYNEDAKQILDEEPESKENMLAGSEPFWKLEKQEDEVNNQAGEEALQSEDQDLRSEEYDPHFKRTLKLIENENNDNLDDEKPPWDEDEEEYDFGEPNERKEESANTNPWADGTRKRAL